MEVPLGDTKGVQEGKSRFREAAINALLSENTIEKAAEKAKVSKRTLLRWMQEPNFRADYARAKANVLKMASAILVRNSAKAALVLAEIFSSEKGGLHQSARVAAAIGNIRLAREAFELESLEERITALEENLRATT